MRGERPEEVSYAGAAEPLQDVWIAVRANLRAVLEHVTSPTCAGQLPDDGSRRLSRRRRTRRLRR